MVDAVLSASRALVAVSARSLAALPEDVTLPQYRALVVIAARGPQRLADLAVALGVEPSTATRMCDRLVRKDLVYRRRTSTDRRGVRISLAVAGRELVEEVTRRRRAEIVAILGRVPAGTKEMVLAGLSALAEAAGEPGEREWALGWASTHTTTRRLPAMVEGPLDRASPNTKGRATGPEGPAPGAAARGGWAPMSTGCLT